MGSAFWRGLREWGQELMEQGVFTRDEIDFGHVTDSPKEAVDFILASLPPEVRATLRPLA
jgi:predicted Rossmann-fold nucleotide-binding protein